MAASVRNLVAGSGTVTTTVFTSNRPTKLTFSANQSAVIIVGSTVRVNNPTPLWFTIARSAGDGLVYYTNQDYNTSLGALGFKVTDPSTARGRGGSTVSDLVADAVYYQYMSMLDDAGVPDWYGYVDTVPPLNGCHPFTKDQWTGKSWATSPTQAQTQTGVLIPNLGERVAALDAEPPVIY